MADPQNRPSDDAPQNEASQNQKAGPFPQLPIQFGRYRIERLLGKGAMGAVYLAQDVQLDRPVALKVARISKAGSAKLIKRMETEAMILVKSTGSVSSHCSTLRGKTFDHTCLGLAGDENRLKPFDGSYSSRMPWKLPTRKESSIGI
jgi:hypothetical protein